MDDTRTDAQVTGPLAAQAARPSAPWYGAMIAGLLWFGFAYLLAYTCLDLGWQQSIGSWNYVVLIGMLVLLSVILKRWQPDLRRYSAE